MKNVLTFTKDLLAHGALFVTLSYMAWQTYQSLIPLPLYNAYEDPDYIYWVRPITRGCISPTELRGEIQIKGERGLGVEVCPYDDPSHSLYRPF
tara:strand:- start:69 stop:350 length:282 start_codon:yes stop_codon:yes gene_type:complete